MTQSDSHRGVDLVLANFGHCLHGGVSGVALNMLLRKLLIWLQVEQHLCAANRETDLHANVDIPGSYSGRNRFFDSSIMHQLSWAHIGILGGERRVLAKIAPLLHVRVICLQRDRSAIYHQVVCLKRGTCAAPSAKQAAAPP